MANTNAQRPSPIQAECNASQISQCGACHCDGRVRVTRRKARRGQLACTQAPLRGNCQRMQSDGRTKLTRSRPWPAGEASSQILGRHAVIVMHVRGTLHLHGLLQRQRTGSARADVRGRPDGRPEPATGADAARVFTRVGARENSDLSFSRTREGPGFTIYSTVARAYKPNTPAQANESDDVMQNGVSLVYLFFCCAGRAAARAASLRTIERRLWWRTALKRTDATHGAVFSCRVG